MTYLTTSSSKVAKSVTFQLRVANLVDHLSDSGGKSGRLPFRFGRLLWQTSLVPLQLTFHLPVENGHNYGSPINSGRQLWKSLGVPLNFGRQPRQTTLVDLRLTLQLWVASSVDVRLTLQLRVALVLLGMHLTNAYTLSCTIGADYSLCTLSRFVLEDLGAYTEGVDGGMALPLWPLPVTSPSSVFGYLATAPARKGWSVARPCPPGPCLSQPPPFGVSLLVPGFIGAHFSTSSGNWVFEGLLW